MRRNSRWISLGLAVTALPVALVAQSHGSRPAGFGTLNAPRTEPRSLSGFGSLPAATPPRTVFSNGERAGGWGSGESRGHERMGMGRGFIGPRVWGYSAVAVPAPAPTTVAVPYPVPYPVMVPSPAASAPAPAPPPVPYDPTKSHMTIVGKGADGGGGVMKLTRGPRELRVTWLANDRPVREATLFLADSEQRPTRARPVDLLHRDVVFGLAETEKAAFVGLTLVFSDGATRTTLVPLTD